MTVMPSCSNEDEVKDSASEEEQPTCDANRDNGIEERICRICLCGEQEQEQNHQAESLTATFARNINNNNNHDAVEPLISPCLCRGSMKYVHPSCLQSWRAAASRNESTIRCDQCHYEYHINRTTVALFLMSENGPIALAAVFILLVIHLFGLAMFFLITTKGFRDFLYDWIQLTNRRSYVDDEGMDQIDIRMFLTESRYGEILTLGAATLGFLTFIYHVITTCWESYNNYREVGAVRFEAHYSIIFLAFWIYGETMEAQRGRGLAVVGLFVALYNSYATGIKYARDAAQWLGETILEPAQSSRIGR